MPETRASVVLSSTLRISLVKDQAVLSTASLDLHKQYPMLTKELALRAVAARPDLSGRPWGLALGLDGVGTTSPSLRLQAHAADATDCTQALAVMDMPIVNLAWFATQMARRAGLKGCSYSYRVRIELPDAAATMPDSESEDDFEFSDDAAQVVLPAGLCRKRPAGHRRTVGPDKTGWLRCVFTEAAFDRFVAAAAAEATRERAWLSLGPVCLSEDACDVVIEELIELPGEATAEGMTTLAGDWLRLHERCNGRLSAFLHLHPREIEGQAMTPNPSANDSCVAWHIDTAAGGRPTVFPIALFGADAANGDVAAHGYVGGLLSRIPLDVIET